MAMYGFLLLVGQSAASLLGRLYYDKGGKSKWLAALVQLVASPLLLPYVVFSAPRKPSMDSIRSRSPSKLILSSIYLSIGILAAGDSILYSVGLMYLPLSTYSLISSSQLAFNALFSFFLNSQKFTPFIVNSLVLLTISSVLLVIQTDSTGPSMVSRGNYIIGFICTTTASAGTALVCCLIQLTFRKVLKRKTLAEVMKVIAYPSMLGTLAIMVGLFGSGEWKGLKREMEEFRLGKVSYLMTLIWKAILWQVLTVGSIGLVSEASSLFANSVSVLAVPIVPILAVIFFQDKLGGMKVMAMLLAIWGFISYAYQQYLDDLKSKPEYRNSDEVPNA